MFHDVENDVDQNHIRNEFVLIEYKWKKFKIQPFLVAAYHM